MNIVEDEDRLNFELQISSLKELIVKKDEQIQQTEKELNFFRTNDHKSHDYDVRSKASNDNSINITGDENNSKEKLEKCKIRLKQLKQETESYLQQVIIFLIFRIK